MKKVLISIIGLAAVAGCTSKYDYFRGDIRYVQDGRDCIYYASEYGENYSNSIRDMDNGKKIVYRDTMCADLYARDNANAAPRYDRSAIVPAARPVASGCGCQACGNDTCGTDTMVLRRRYIIMPTL